MSDVTAAASSRASGRSAITVALVGVATVAAAVGLGAPAAGVAVTLAVYGLAGGLGLAGCAAHHPHARFGVANALTLIRAGGAAVVAGLAVAPQVVTGPTAWAVAAGAAALLALDGVDGWAARRQGLASAFGARFDMETDALTILALAALALALGKAGPWVLALGLMRYGFVAAGVMAPWLARALPASWRRKAVCVIQVGALTVLVAPVVTPPLSALIAAVALALLAWSFAVDLRWLARTRP